MEKLSLSVQESSMATRKQREQTYKHEIPQARGLLNRWYAKMAQTNLWVEQNINHTGKRPQATVVHHPFLLVLSRKKAMMTRTQLPKQVRT